MDTVSELTRQSTKGNYELSTWSYLVARVEPATFWRQGTKPTIKPPGAMLAI